MGERGERRTSGGHLDIGIIMIDTLELISCPVDFTGTDSAMVFSSNTKDTPRACSAAAKDEVALQLLFLLEMPRLRRRGTHVGACLRRTYRRLAIHCETQEKRKTLLFCTKIISRNLDLFIHKLCFHLYLVIVPQIPGS